jgi:hypothetical protein
MMRSWLRWPAWFCLSLLLWTAAAESTHQHPNQTEAASCSICVAAHTASPALSATHRTPFFTTVGLFHEKDVAAQARLEFSELGIRGPPAAL